MKKILLSALALLFTMIAYSQAYKGYTVEATTKLTAGDKFVWKGTELKKDSIAYFEQTTDSVRFRSITGQWGNWYKRSSIPSISDDILHWDGYKYAPYPSKKSENPGYAYFYNGDIYGNMVYNYENWVYLDGRISAGVFKTTYDDEFYTESSALSNAGISFEHYNKSDQHTYQAGLGIGANNELYLTTYLSYPFDQKRAFPIRIGETKTEDDYHGQNLIIDDYNKKFQINIDTILLSKGIPSKWLALDSNKNIVYMNDPSTMGGDVYKGVWNANTNSPTLANGTGTTGWYYRCTTAGTALGQTFAVGDKAQYNGTIWEKIPGTDYTLPYSTSAVLGGVKIGSGVSVTGDGTISVSTNYAPSSTVSFPGFGTTHTLAANGDHSHNASAITQDASNRFVTDTEKSAWTAKQEALAFFEQSVSNGVYTYSLPFTLKSTAQVFYNGYLLNNSRWTGWGTTSITLYIDPKLYDVLKIQN